MSGVIQLRNQETVRGGLCINVIINHAGQYRGGSYHRSERVDWHSQDYRLPGNVLMPRNPSDCVPLWKAIAEHGARRMLAKPPVTALWIPAPYNEDNS